MATMYADIIDLSENELVLGSKAGAELLAKLRACTLEKYTILHLSFEGIRCIDACAVRESLASLQKMNIGKLGIVVTNIENQDVIDNLLLGFKAKGLPLITLNSDYTVSVHTNGITTAKPVLEHIYKTGETTTSTLIKPFDLSAPNASAKLKKLSENGFLNCRKETAESGGIEYIFSPYISAAKVHIF